MHLRWYIYMHLGSLGVLAVQYLFGFSWRSWRSWRFSLWFYRRSSAAENANGAS